MNAFNFKIEKLPSAYSNTRENMHPLPACRDISITSKFQILYNAKEVCNKITCLEPRERLKVPEKETIKTAHLHSQIEAECEGCVWSHLQTSHIYLLMIKERAESRVQIIEYHSIKTMMWCAEASTSTIMIDHPFPAVISHIYPPPLQLNPSPLGSQTRGRLANWHTSSQDLAR